MSGSGQTSTVHIPMTFRKRGGRLVVTPDGLHSSTSFGSISRPRCLSEPWGGGVSRSSRLTYEGATPGWPVRMTVGRKREAVLRLLRGEPLEIVAREVGVTAADLSSWRDAFLKAGAESLKARAGDDRDATIDRLRTKVGELTMDAELLQAKIERLEAGAVAALLGRGGRSDERRHLDLRRPPLRRRPRLPGVGRVAVEPLPRPDAIATVGAAAAAGAAGTNARQGPG
jgi:hypothetical protein